jgi:hypothetical protein
MMDSIFLKLVNDHYKYYESSVNTRRFKYEDIIHLITGLRIAEGFSVETVGKSFQGRDIYCVRWGQGSKDILLWSQMHGDESTATRALFDIWKFLGTDGDLYDKERKSLSEEVTLHFVPMLNPDGTNQWQRRTLQDIDMNRDAVRLQTPEARILKSLCDTIKPLFGFNLHDQSPYYSAGYTDRPATISFLAPAYNKAKDINEVRRRSMQLISYLNLQIQELLPGHVGKYDDTFNPRAFGDNIQKWGISTVLVESGGYPDDPEKEHIRKINFALILDGIASIANQSYLRIGIEEYEKIPFNNKEHFFDLIIRNAAIKRNGLEYKVDIAINREEHDLNNHRGFYYFGKIVDIGDMSMFYGYEEIDLNGMELNAGKVYPYIFDTHEEALNFNMKKVLENGYTSVVIDDALLNEQFTNLPLNIQIKDEAVDHEIAIEEYANLVAREEGEVKLTIVNGFVYKSEDKNFGIANSLVINS